jgi:hypothetical protein
MKVDETIDSFGKVWQQITVLIILHLVFLACAIVARVVPLANVRADVQNQKFQIALPKLESLHEDLKKIGLELPVFAGIISVIYLVTFQRLSLVIGKIPVVRLTYSQPALWKAGRRFDELRQLIHQFEGYTASRALEDLEVTLGLAIAQYNKQFEEHYQDLVESKLVAAKICSDYYSGFALLLICSIAILARGHHYCFFGRGVLLPLGILLSMLISRCCWEALIEAVVVGRLQFALDCAIISGEQKSSETNIRRASQGSGVEDVFEEIVSASDAIVDNNIWTSTDPSWRSFKTPSLRHKAQVFRVLAADITLAAELAQDQQIMDPHRLWVLHLVQPLCLFLIGALPYVPKKQFQRWMFEQYWTRIQSLLRSRGFSHHGWSAVSNQMLQDFAIDQLADFNSALEQCVWLKDKAVVGPWSRMNDYREDELEQHSPQIEGRPPLLEAGSFRKRRKKTGPVAKIPSDSTFRT